MKYYIICGERSGDLHASNLIKSIKKEDPSAQFRGIGGEYCQSAGADIFFHYEEISFMGIMTVVKNIPTIKKAMKRTQQDILEYKPDVVLLVDFSGYNLRIARFVKEHGLKVFYYISPKIWAWNTKRAYKIKALVDRMFVIMPFEKEFYKRYDYEVDYVGNPVYDSVSTFIPDIHFRRSKGLNEKPIIAILPGSRKQEVKNMLGYMAQVIPSFKDYQFVIAGVTNLPKSYYQVFEEKGIKVLYDDTYDLLSNSAAAIVTSGTATLETAMFEVPQVVCYKTGALSYAIGKPLLKVKFISLVNLIAGREVVKELLQGLFTPANIIAELNNILNDSAYRADMLGGYKEVKNILGSPGTSGKAAKLMVGYLKSELVQSLKNKKSDI